MKLEKHSIPGKKGKTVCYSITGFEIEEKRINKSIKSEAQLTETFLKWDDFRFYTPLGTETDADGYQYYDVPADRLQLERDDDINKTFLLKVTVNDGIEALEILEGAQHETITIGLEGDILANAYIPADKSQEIVIHYKEVTDGKN